MCGLRVGLRIRVGLRVRVRVRVRVRIRVRIRVRVRVRVSSLGQGLEVRFSSNTTPTSRDCISMVGVGVPGGAGGRGVCRSRCRCVGECI